MTIIRTMDGTRLPAEVIHGHGRVSADAVARVAFAVANGARGTADIAKACGYRGRAVVWEALRVLDEEGIVDDGPPSVAHRPYVSHHRARSRAQHPLVRIVAFTPPEA